MPCHMWRWVSTMPGITIMRPASITSALGAAMFGRTAEILPFSTSTSACSKSPTARSRLSTQPPLIRTARPAAAGCCARAVPIAAPTTLEAATAVAALVQRKSRRESAGDGLHALQEQDVMESSRCLLLCANATAVRAALPAFARVLIGKPVPTFPGHAPARQAPGDMRAWVAAHCSLLRRDAGVLEDLAVALGVRLVDVVHLRRRVR